MAGLDSEGSRIGAHEGSNSPLKVQVILKLRQSAELNVDDRAEVIPYRKKTEQVGKSKKRAICQVFSESSYNNT